MISRRHFLSAASALAIAFANPVLAGSRHGTTLMQPANASIPVSSLANGNYPANNWTGFTTVATTVASHVMTPNPNNQQIFATGNGVWRDHEISTYVGGRGALYLRLGGDGQALFCQFNFTGLNSVQIGVVQNFVATAGVDGGATGTFYAAYVNLNPTGTLTGYGTGAVYTFGTNGFEIYLKINGVKVVSYMEWRLCRPGQMAAWAQSGVSADITATYLPLQFLYSAPAINVFDPRDFGMRSVAATTGSMTLGSNQITGVTAGSFQIGDQIIVCTGGEVGAGANGTKGVGGTWPALNYANTTVMNADHSQATGTFAYDASSSPLANYYWDGSAWSHLSSSANVPQTLYTYNTIALPLVATVTGVAGTTVTVNKTAAVATTNAAVRLDCLPSFYVLNQTLMPIVGAGGFGSFSPNLPNVTVSIPSSQSTADQAWHLSNQVPTPILPAANCTIAGAGRTLTTLKSPRGTPPGAFDIEGLNTNGFVISDMKYVGNNAADGGFFANTANTFVSFSTVFRVISPGAVSTGVVVKNVDVVEPVGQACVINANSHLMDNSTCTFTNPLLAYVQWMFQSINSSLSIIQNCTVTSPYLIKSFEFFACNGSKIINCGGQNCLFSTNSSTSWEIDCRGVTINYLADAYYAPVPITGALDEAIFNVNDNAFGGGSTGTIRLGRHIQQGYIQTSTFTSLKFIQVATAQTDVTIVGAYPGVGGCTNLLDGYLEAPDYNAATAEYGAMAIYSDAARTISNGIRIKGAAIGTPGHSGHFGNISLIGASSQANNNVADVIQTGPTLSGNQTNAAYGGC